MEHETMRVEVTEAKLRDAGYDLREGDTITVPRAVGEDWCAHGWARDTAGEVPTGERRVVMGAAVNPKKAAHAHTEVKRG